MNVSKAGTAGGFGYDPRLAQTQPDPLASPQQGTASAAPADDQRQQAQAIAGAMPIPKPIYGPTGMSVDQQTNLLDAITNDQIVSGAAVDLSI